MKKDKIILAILIMTVIGIIITITLANQPKNTDEQTMQCIAENSKLIVSKTCGHCAHQKEILGDHLNKFTLLSVDENPGLYEEYNLIGVPTWIINENTYPGLKSIEQLKELTGC